MSDFTVTRNVLWGSLLFFAAIFGFNACSDTNNVSSGTEPAPPSPPTPLVITTTTTTFRSFVFERFPDFTWEAAGGTPPYTWSIKETDPLKKDPAPGLKLSSLGVITGTPTVPGDYPRIYQVTDAAGQSKQKQLTIMILIRAASVQSAASTGTASITGVREAPPAVKPFTLPNGTVNVAYPAIRLEATGGIPPYTWSVSPALPNGLVLNLLGPGVISGTPLNASTGQTTYTFTVMDSIEPTAQLSKLTRTLTINAALTIDTGPSTGLPLPVGTVGQPYHALLSASGATGPGTYTWAIVGNLLPAPGLQPLSSDGVIRGTPTTPGSYTRTYRVENGTGVVVTKSLTLNVNALLSIDSDNTTLPLPLGIEGQPYGPARLTASGGTPPYVWSVTPPLPAPLTLDSVTGEITGTPDVATVGTTAHTFTVEDSASQIVKKPLYVTINP